ncbi:hypothetical protein DSCO28_15690 [Desulfosarcina ovata subsp. sediminis]|uniref:Sigma-54 factor interaction domain-containing protein n=1 Tax=Desulfosarcina ovata subsp. sediminis TaxID=885957 RepID=A0A5K7ZRB1_9BACT|nr:sigma 54-interacting transcriptional regulator [Desulfosarcina ovata]BBO81003.1 hypothetical protein DSCO28_15690 [Desulfosarcina ovata subsp. sediminis]
MDTETLTGFIDRLRSHQRDTLELAALLGDHFSLDNLLELINQTPSQIFDFIDLLLDEKLIKNRSGRVKGAYVFSNKQIPALVIKSMAGDKKQLYISNIIHYFEKYGRDDNQKTAQLVSLILNYKNDLADMRYLKQAADLLMQDRQSDQAIKLYREIIEKLYAKNRDEIETVLFIESVIAYATIAININPPMEIIPIVQEALKLSKALENRRAETILELFLGRLHQRKGLDYEVAAAHYNRGWTLASTMDDKELQQTTSKLYALSLFWRGRITQAIVQYEETIENVEDIDPELADVWTYLILALCYAKAGRIWRGLGLAKAVMARAEAIGYNKAIAFSHSIIAVILLDIEKVKTAKRHVEKTIALGSEIGSNFALLVGMLCKAYIHYKENNFPSAKKLLEKALQHAQDPFSVNYPSPWVLEMLLGFSKAEMPSLKQCSFAAEAKRLAGMQNIYMKGAALRYQAVTLPTDTATLKRKRDLLMKSCELLEESGAAMEMAWTYIALARLHLESKDMDGARRYAEAAYTQLSQIDQRLFPAQLNCLVVQESMESSKDRGVNNLEDSISLLPDFEKYIGRIVTILTEMFGAERTAILVAGETVAPASMRVAAARNFTHEEIEKLRDPSLQIYLLDKVSQKGVVIDSKQNCVSLFAKLEKHDVIVRSLALIPIWIDSRTVGLIYIDNRLFKGIFSAEDEVLLRSISGQISMAIKTCELHEKYGNLHLYLSEEEKKPNDFIPSGHDFPMIIGKSRAMKNVLFGVKKVATTDTAVLIQGETGVGKELIARAIHKLSNRATKTLTIVNISALSEGLITAELFGHEKGAFTGATSAKPGRFELANGGTIFLDEIGELTMEAQVKLLRVLQEGKFERVGSSKPIYSDFRVIAATNKNLIDRVKKGAFRSDLFYRISSFPIEIPPLRERQDDIADLTLYFMKKYAHKNKKKVNRILTNDIAKLHRYSWPGNVRELEHFIERAVIITTGENLALPEIESTFDEKQPAARADSDDGLDLLENVQRRHILKVMKRTNWKIRGKDGAAIILGLKPTTLEFRIKKLNIR